MNRLRPDPATLAWLRRQVADPAPVYSIHELSRLCGARPERVKRWLIKRHILAAKLTRDHHGVDSDTLLRLWPDFWRAIRRRVAAKCEEAEAA